RQTPLGAAYDRKHEPRNDPSRLVKNESDARHLSGPGFKPKPFSTLRRSEHRVGGPSKILPCAEQLSEGKALLRDLMVGAEVVEDQLSRTYEDRSGPPC